VGLELKKAKGSLTVEAAIIIPFFLFVFLLFLYIIRILYVQAALDQAVKAAGRDVAAVSYPLALLQEFQEELQAQGEAPAGPAGDGEQRYTELLLRILGESGEDLSNDLLERGGAVLVRSLLGSHLETYRLDPARLTIELIHLPQSQSGFAKEKGKTVYQETGLLPEVDFFPEDVVIQAEYTLTLPLPFLSGNSFPLKSAVTERAWLSGGNGIYPLRREKGIFEQAAEKRGTMVYVTKTGIRYHLSDCRYLKKSKIPLPVAESREKGYTPCRVCHPETVENP
jgi:hypothetical protein